MTHQKSCFQQGRSLKLWFPRTLVDMITRLVWPFLQLCISFYGEIEIIGRSLPYQSYRSLPPCSQFIYFDWKYPWLEIVKSENLLSMFWPVLDFPKFSSCIHFLASNTSRYFVFPTTVFLATGVPTWKFSANCTWFFFC